MFKEVIWYHYKVKTFFRRTEIPCTKGRISKIFTEIKNEINYKKPHIDITMMNNKSLRRKHIITKLM